MQRTVFYCYIKQTSHLAQYITHASHKLGWAVPKSDILTYSVDQILDTGL